jgi:hypothetical protein
MGGLNDGSFTDFLCIHSLPSCFSMHSLAHSLIHPHPHLGLGKGNRIDKELAMG